MSDLDLDELRSELDDFSQPEKKGGRSPREERIIAGFEDIQRFVEKHGSSPQHGEKRDIFERLYAVRLDRLRALEECRAILAPLDHQGLLAGTEMVSVEPVESMDEDERLAELGGAAGSSEITELRHVRASAEKRAAEEIADHIRCADFDRFKPLFTQVKKELETGVRETRPFGKDAAIKQGDFFIVGGQTAYVAEIGEEFITDYDRRNNRLRVIYDNGTESDILLRSLQRALYKDEAGRRITNPSVGPLFGNDHDEDDLESGTIYVLRSKSEHPEIAANRTLIHKIGVTGGKVETRICNASVDPTYLLADVEVVATYKLFNIKRSKLENLIHRVFAAARLDLTIEDRFGQPVKPREWFLVPLNVIDAAIDKIRDGSIVEFTYDPLTASLNPLE